MAIKCYYTNDRRAGRVFIPECWGGVLDGPEGCYCDRILGKKERIDLLEDRIRRLEQKLKLLENEREECTKP